jgi:hypothetical protein
MTNPTNQEVFEWLSRLKINEPIAFDLGVQVQNVQIHPNGASSWVCLDKWTHFCLFDGDRYLNGVKLQNGIEIRFWDHPLTSAEVDKLYGEGFS